MEFVQLLQSSTVALYTTVFVIGLLIGSFLNVVIYRLPVMMENQWRRDSQSMLGLEADGQKDPEPFNLIKPDSRCGHCQTSIKPWQNIPIISYLFLRGKCHACGASISLRYPLVELATGLLSLGVAVLFGPSYELMAALLLVWSLIALTMIDIDHQLLPDSITLPLLWCGLIVNSFDVFTSLHSAVMGAVFGYLSLWSVFWLFKLATGKEGMGFGDFKLLAALGAWFGWEYLFLTILLSSFVGAFVGILGIVLLGRDKQIPIPFGPYLAVAGLIAGFWGDQIIQVYFQWLGV